MGAASQALGPESERCFRMPTVQGVVTQGDNSQNGWAGGEPSSCIFPSRRVSLERNRHPGLEQHWENAIGAIWCEDELGEGVGCLDKSKRVGRG